MARSQSRKRTLYLPFLALTGRSPCSVTCVKPTPTSHSWYCEKVGLTDFLRGCKLEKEHPRGGHHAKRTTQLYEGVQTGSRASGTNFREIAVASRPRLGH